MELSQIFISQNDRLEYKLTKKVVSLGGYIEEWLEHAPPVVDMRIENSPAKVFVFFFFFMKLCTLQ